jgi:hypothetical protein
MPAWLLGASGVALLLVVLVDVLSTTLTIGTHAGPFTRRVLGLAWRGLLRLHRQDSSSRVLSTAGVVLLVASVLVWLALVWAGWTLVFLSGEDTVVSSTTGEPAGVLDTVYYVGVTLSTLGVGDFVAGSGGWRLVTTLAAFSGLVLITLAITYLLAVVSAVVTRRSLAVRIAGLGDTAAGIVVGGWTGERFSPAFVQHLAGLAEQVAHTAERHLAYPVVHYFHSAEPESAAPLAVARLDDALLLLEGAVAEGARPDPSAIRPLRRAVDRYLSAAGSTAGPGRSAVPPVPDAGPLRSAGIPLVPATEFLRRAADEADRRSRLAELVRSDGWSWPGSEISRAPRTAGPCRPRSGR